MRDGVVLNVGGTLFSTSHATMTQRDCFFRALVEHGEDNTCFIDRDPTHFRHILNYLRNSPTFPTCPHAIDEMIQEADFYSLTDLVEQCKLKRESCRRSTIEHTLQIIAAKLG